MFPETALAVFRLVEDGIVDTWLVNDKPAVRHLAF